MVNVAVCAALVVLTAAAAKLKDAGVTLARTACPVPLNATVGAVPGEPLVNDSTPLRAPLAVGVNTTFTMQLAPAANDVPQLFVWAKSPLIVTPVIETGRSPEFENVTDCTALDTFKSAGANDNDAGAAVTCMVSPVPLRFNGVGGVPNTLPITNIVPGRLPELTGWNVTFTLQLAPGCRDAPQLFVCV